MPQRPLIAALEALFGRMTLAECVDRFGAADCCLTPVLTLAEALESEYCRSRQAGAPVLPKSEDAVGNN